MEKLGIALVISIIHHGGIVPMDDFLHATVQKEPEGQLDHNRVCLQALHP